MPQFSATHDDADEQQYTKPARAGLIPYTFDSDGNPVFLLMVASNPKMGGPRPMISKGKIEGGESAMECALREAEEELGLLQRNMKTGPIHLIDEYVTLRSGAYDLSLYYCEISERWDFGPWDDETYYTVWLSLDQARAEARRDHVRFLEMVANIVTQE